MKRMKIIKRKTPVSAPAPTQPRLRQRQPVRQRQRQPVQQAELPDDRIKTTLSLRNHIYLFAKQRARDIGLTLNGYVTVLIDRERTGMAPAVAGQPAPLAAQPMAPVSVHILPSSHERKPRVDPLERFLEKHPIYTQARDPDNPEDRPVSCEWDHAHQFWEVIGRLANSDNKKDNQLANRLINGTGFDAANLLRERGISGPWEHVSPEEVSAMIHADNDPLFGQYEMMRKKSEDLKAAAEEEA